MTVPFKFSVSPEKDRSLRERMERLGIDEKDITERFVRSRGHGGQNVNKTSTCVYLKHIPTGVEVKCQRERSQALNRFLARRILVDKIEGIALGKESSRQQAREKIKRQKRRRSRRAKEKVLHFKHLTGEKKKDRSFRPGNSDYPDDS
ncbi:MAG: peptide chain release factor-like protein [Syntrophorhabdaceae bacterium]|nr:peptide chain release factor-like protein [Syntrophorhabdaceae bacterium]